MLTTDIKQLERRLARDPSGPLFDLSREATRPLLRLLGAAGRVILRATEERPLTALLIAFETGFAVARVGGRHANR